MTEFAELVLGEDEPALRGVRETVRATLGDEGLVDSAAVAALFNAIDRVADATGIPLEDWKAEDTADFRADLGINEYQSMQYRPAYEQAGR